MFYTNEWGGLPYHYLWFIKKKGLLGDFSLTKNLFLSTIVLSPIIILKGGKDETTKKFKAEADDP